VHSTLFVDIRAAVGFFGRTRRIEQVRCAGREGRGKGEQESRRVGGGSLLAARGTGNTCQRDEERLVPLRGGGEDKSLTLVAELLDHVAKTGPPMRPRGCQRSYGQHTGVVQVRRCLRHAALNFKSPNSRCSKLQESHA
jgi:hypothetical protein